MLFRSVSQSRYRRVDKEDLIQEGMIGLLKAIRGYDKEKLASFKTFASICIKRQLITAIKSANSQKNMALNTAVGMTSDNDENKELVYTKGLESYVSYSPEELYLTKEQLSGLKDYLEAEIRLKSCDFRPVLGRI